MVMTGPLEATETTAPVNVLVLETIISDTFRRNYPSAGGCISLGGRGEGKSGLITAAGGRFGARNRTGTEVGSSSSRHRSFRPWPKLPVVPAGPGSSRIQCLLSAGCGRDEMSCHVVTGGFVVVLSLVRCRRRHIPPDIAEPWQ